MLLIFSIFYPETIILGKIERILQCLLYIFSQKLQICNPSKVQSVINIDRKMFCVALQYLW